MWSSPYDPLLPVTFTRIHKNSTFFWFSQFQNPCISIQPCDKCCSSCCITVVVLCCSLAVESSGYSMANIGEWLYVFAFKYADMLVGYHPNDSNAAWLIEELRRQSGWCTQFLNSVCYCKAIPPPGLSLWLRGQDLQSANWDKSDRFPSPHCTGKSTSNSMRHMLHVRRTHYCALSRVIAKRGHWNKSWWLYPYMDIHGHM